MIIHCDGACGENHFAYGWISLDRTVRGSHAVNLSEDTKDGEITFTGLSSLRNAAEYLAIIGACSAAERSSIILSDSKLAVKQINNEWKINHPHLLFLCLAARRLMCEKNLDIRWLPREGNLAHNIVEEAIRSEGE